MALRPMRKSHPKKPEIPKEERKKIKIKKKAGLWMHRLNGRYDDDDDDGGGARKWCMARRTDDVTKTDVFLWNARRD